METRRFVWLGGLLLLVSGALSLPGAAQEPPQHQAVINKYCTSCHNDKLKTGGFSLSEMSVTDLSGHTDEWEKVTRKLRGRQMPPLGRPRPDEATYDALVGYLESSLDRIAASHPNPGRTETFRRLTRTEYRNAIR